MTFAIITPALITGATADRWKFGAFVAFVTVWSIVIYAPVAHWVFDGYGWLNRSLQPAGKFFAEDFAGGTVVHINAGAAGLAMALVLGKRRGWPREKMRGNNIPFVMLGAGLLWFGWFGFNAGSALTAGNLASYAWVNTNTATATALLGWIIVEKLRYGKSTALGAASGAVAGLVAITPCAGFVSPIGSIFIGLLAGSICAFAINLKNRFGYDDSLDVVGVHFVRRLDRHAVRRLLQHHRNQRARRTTASSTAAGASTGRLEPALHQFMAAGAVTVFSFVGTSSSPWSSVCSSRTGSPRTRSCEGLDIAIHGESAYDSARSAGSVRVTTCRPRLEVKRRWTA